MECVLESTKEKVLAEAKAHQTKSDLVREKLLLRTAGQPFYNASPLSLDNLSDTQTADDLMSYAQSFSTDAREIFEHFHFEDFVQQLASNDLLYKVVQRFVVMDLRPQNITNFGMSIIFEKLIRKFAESSNETAGEHFTPRDIVRLTTSLVITEQDHKLKPNSIITIYDPTAGTGGFLSEGDKYIQAISDKVMVSLHGQELNPESYAICKADMLIKGQTASNIKLGNTLFEDQLTTNHFDFMLSNPPFGVEWKKVQKQVTNEHKQQGFDGRFGPGLPRVSDGSLLFLLHLVSKMRDPHEGGSRIGIILNGSPLFTGGAGSGESKIRRYLLQNDLVEAIVALPTDMFYNTCIATYVWILSNRKPEQRQGKIQLIDGTQQFSKMRKSLGSKRQYINDEQIDELVSLYGRFEETPQSNIFPIETFGYRRITIERPLRLAFQVAPERVKTALANKTIQKLDGVVQSLLGTALTGMDREMVYLNREQFSKVLKQTLMDHGLTLKVPAMKALLNALGERHPDADICRVKGKPEPDTRLRDYENVPLEESVQMYFEREVKPHVPDAWIKEGKCDALNGEMGIIGFEILFNQIIYRKHIEELETQYSEYKEYTFKELAVEINQVNKYCKIFTDKKNSVYISRTSSLSITNELPKEEKRHKYYFQIVLNSRAINEYITLFFKSDLGILILNYFRHSLYHRSREDIKRLTIALPNIEIQEQILVTHRKLDDLKKAIDSFDSEISLNPTRSNSVLEKLENMLNSIDNISDPDKVINLIRKGESKWVEFKETLTLNVKEQKRDKRITESALKTIVAFLNTEGGVLIVGVSDNKIVTGLESEIDNIDNKNIDKFLLRFKNHIKDKIGEDFYKYIEYRIIEVKDKKVLFIDCKQSNDPCFLCDSDFYIRTNPATDKLTGRKLGKYIRQHFEAEVV